MARCVKEEDLFKCETCKHGDNGRCYASVWCEHHEEYIPDIRKLKVIDSAEIVECKDCDHHVLTEIGFDGYPLNTPKEICKMWGKELTDMNGFCSRGKRKE